MCESTVVHGYKRSHGKALGSWSIKKYRFDITGRTDMPMMTRFFLAEECVSEQRKVRHCGAVMSHGSKEKLCRRKTTSRPMQRIPKLAKIIAVLRRRSQKKM